MPLLSLRSEPQRSARIWGRKGGPPGVVVALRCARFTSRCRSAGSRDGRSPARGPRGRFKGRRVVLASDDHHPSAPGTAALAGCRLAVDDLAGRVEALESSFPRRVRSPATSLTANAAPRLARPPAGAFNRDDRDGLGLGRTTVAAILDDERVAKPAKVRGVDGKLVSNASPDTTNARQDPR